MDKDLDYFKDFLANPSAVSLWVFYEMLSDWGNYLLEHKGEFNYLEDEEWREIRERLKTEYRIREADKADLEYEWEYLNDLSENPEALTDEEIISVLWRKVALIKAYREYFDFDDEELLDMEKKAENLMKAKKEAHIANENLRRSEEIFDKSLADMDDLLLNIEKKTGKIPKIQFYQAKKPHNGN